ncbi:tRNA (adenine-N1)-methyltransferase [Pyrobaculum neutrophilum]|uniref:tRNA methyltransferase complex GCD14 subunit n=1 Tax=Pyrobaculum neutrophilum (strain DSM 2338 / JCM 9278 / NBRC 100436 / V24Sta) TaxID=444157 RepID=B1Y964_PYRNV|nr:tRNA (adenine-N1)-methyltransferase [Pyrobaculum neutrophilum]ACB40293.1 tRNA methyltransferase complex GCD14 subunit [Pyrobaculum neutrophilum V24Sta]
MFKKGDWALFVEERGGYKTVARVGSGKIQTVRGYIDTDEAVGLPHGAFITTSLGVRFKALPATVFDVIEHRFRLGAQAIYPKDALYILKAASIGPGSVVAEAGTGSGFLTAVLAWYVRPWGVIYSFEKRLEHLRIAVRNIKIAGLDQYVELQLRDVVESGFGPLSVDAVVLDMGDPWNAVGNALEILKPGGTLAIFSTTVEHMSKSIEALRKNGLLLISVEEVSIRRWKPIPGELRPETFDVVHTGWIIAARRA